MMDLVLWSRALRAEREHEAARHQRASRARAVLREPAAALRGDAVRTLLPPAEQRRRAPQPACCIFGAGA